MVDWLVRALPGTVRGLPDFIFRRRSVGDVEVVFVPTPSAPSPNLSSRPQEVTNVDSTRPGPLNPQSNHPTGILVDKSDTVQGKNVTLIYPDIENTSAQAKLEVQILLRMLQNAAY